MSECTHNCNTCGVNCGEKRQNVSTKAPLNEFSSVHRVIAVSSGKGGIGKSMVTALLAVLARRKGLRVGILDADITGPSIPRAFGLRTLADNSPDGLYPVPTKTGIEVMSVNLLLQNDTDPVIWRGAVLADTVRQFWSEVVWDDLDLLFIDCPPGTGDVPLTVLQTLPVDGVITVTSPQELVGMIVEKSVRMAEALHVPVLGLVENMSYYVCPHCGGTHPIGASRAEEFAAAHGIKSVAKLPLNPKLAGAADRGMTELFEGDWLDALCDLLTDDLL